jgi:PAS domain S-box-containing protein
MIKRVMSAIQKFLNLCKPILEAGVKSAAPHERARVRQANTIAALLACAAFLHSLFYFYVGSSLMGGIVAVIGLSMLGIPALNYKGKTLAARFYQPILFTAVVAIISPLIGHHAGLSSLFFPAISIAFFVFDYSERRHLIWTVVITMTLAIVSEVVARTVSPVLPVDPASVEAMELSAWVAASFLMLVQLTFHFRSMEASRREVASTHQITDAILEANEDAVMFLDRDMRILYMNPVAIDGFKKTGRTASLGQRFFQIHDELPPPQHRELIERSVENQAPFQVEFFHEGFGWLELRTSPSAQGVSVSYRNINERKQAEASVRESEQLQRTIFEQAATALAVLSPEGTFLNTNAALSQLTGYEESELLGSSIRILLPDSEKEENCSEVRKLTSGELQAIAGERLYLHKSGKALTTYSHLSCLRDVAGSATHLVWAVDDLSERKLAEQRLLQSAKMSSLGEMAGSIAHEINNPMTVISLSAEQLGMAAEDGVVSTKLVEKISERILNTADRITKIIRGLKAFSRNAEHDPMVEVPLQTIVDDSLTLCREKFRFHEIDLRVGEIPDVSLSCRPTEISQVLLNLLTNSFDAVDTLNGDKWVALDLDLRSFGKVTIRVTDSGAGIPERIAARIFEPFFTTKELDKGTGLGLSISKGIIETHGGRFYLDTTAANTSFVIELPLSETASVS